MDIEETHYNYTTKNHHQQALALVNVNRNMSLYGSKTFWKHQNLRNINVDITNRTT